MANFHILQVEYPKGHLAKQCKMWSEQAETRAEKNWGAVYPAASQGSISSLTIWEAGNCFAAGSRSSLWLLASQILLGHFSLQIGIKIPCALVSQKYSFTFLPSLVLDCVFKGYQSPGLQLCIYSTPNLYSVLTCKHVWHTNILLLHCLFLRLWKSIKCFN